MPAPLIFLGAGLAAYETAAGWYETYGEKVICLTPAGSIYTRHSRFVRERIIRGLRDEQVCLQALRQLLTEIRAVGSSEKPLILTADDQLSALLARCCTKLMDDYLLPFAAETAAVWQSKTSLHQWLCKNGFETPAFCSLPPGALEHDNTPDLPLAYPFVLEPDDTAYVEAGETVGRCVVFDDVSLRREVLQLQNQGYDGTLFLQASDPDAWKKGIAVSLYANDSISAFACGDIILTDPAPARFGEPLCLVDANEQTADALFAAAESFIEKSGYRGLLALRFGHDREGEPLTLLSASPHLAGTTGFIEAAGINVWRAIRDGLPGRTKKPSVPFAWLALPPKLAVRSLSAGSGRDRLKARLRRHAHVAYWRAGDRSLKRRRYLWQQAYFLKKRLQRYSEQAK